jgi:uncharacterized OB-fold protein
MKMGEVERYGGAMPLSAEYRWSVGVPMEKFIKSLAEKKLLASKCPECGYIYTPPRNRCGKCNAEIGDKDMLELSGKGVLVSYTVAAVDLDGKGNWTDLKKPAVIGAIKLDGADSTVFLPVDVDPAKAETGMKVEVKWAATPKGEIADLVAVKPATAAKKKK